MSVLKLRQEHSIEKFGLTVVLKDSGYKDDTYNSTGDIRKFDDTLAQNTNLNLNTSFELIE